MFPVDGWGGVVTRRNGIRVPDSTVATVDNSFAAAQMSQDLFGSSFGLSLGPMVRTSTTRTRALYVPATAGIRDDVAPIWLDHEQLLSVAGLPTHLVSARPI